MNRRPDLAFPREILSRSDRGLFLEKNRLQPLGVRRAGFWFGGPGWVVGWFGGDVSGEMGKIVGEDAGAEQWEVDQQTYFIILHHMSQ